MRGLTVATLVLALMVVIFIMCIVWGERRYWLAALIARGLTTNDPDALARKVSDWRAGFDRLHFTNG